MAGVQAAAVVEDRHMATGSQQLASRLCNHVLTCQALYSVFSPSYPGANNYCQVCWQCMPKQLPGIPVVITVTVTWSRASLNTL